MAQSATAFPAAVENTEEAATTTKQEDWRSNLKIPPKDTRVKTEVTLLSFFSTSLFQKLNLL